MIRLDDGEDIIDEALSLFRANCFFRNFEIKGPADRTLIYAIFLVADFLPKILKCNTANEAYKILNAHALGNFAIPGDAGFPLNGMYDKPKDKNEIGKKEVYCPRICAYLSGIPETMKNYFSQLRQEMATRLPDRVMVDGKVSKWWACFSKRKFMNKSL